ncbi:hypothetical protein THAOC_32526 [Thalassiosira oceanica]|uniref:Uncharacterized protein n=1 Tax=Thalassiosira oceanica TaxID=159749 RepID=K0RIF3_THAOC|nr:hypothetical protein THAOC_32526 [Thalassiosira oceanica]|eukprot:EJK48656.1 hypothetical protein THAOC_32526 [Thalassiosira oceanica]
MQQPQVPKQKGTNPRPRLQRGDDTGGDKPPHPPNLNGPEILRSQRRAREPEQEAATSLAKLDGGCCQLRAEAADGLSTDERAKQPSPTNEQKIDIEEASLTATAGTVASSGVLTRRPSSRRLPGGNSGGVVANAIVYCDFPCNLRPCCGEILSKKVPKKLVGRQAFSQTTREMKTAVLSTYTRAVKDSIQIQRKRQGHILMLLGH